MLVPRIAGFGSFCINSRCSCVPPTYLPPPTFGPSFDNRDEDDGMELYIVIIRDSAKYYFTDLRIWEGQSFARKQFTG